ncbi:Intradiol ring-cleavage dioxygenase [Hyaloraphidium curvatum]|nr:Intradiol ring-cleavage dioxygenase [Hyaloraphidium curvatum]
MSATKTTAPATANGAASASELENEVAPRVSAPFALGALVASGLFYWPGALVGDTLLRGTFIGKLLGYDQSNPLEDADGPEYVLSPPQRKFWLYDRRKSGHRGFLASLFGPTISAPLDTVVNALYSGADFASLASHRSAEDKSDSKDTLAMFGRVVDRATGKPVPNATLRAWAADPRGRVPKYGDLDLDYDFRGVYSADPTTGRYAIGTLYPVSIGMYSAAAFYVFNGLLGFVPGILLTAYCKLTGASYPDAVRPPHLHFYVSAPGYRTLCTQIYFPDRLAAGEFDAQLEKDVAHGNKAGPQVAPEQLAHPVLRDEFLAGGKGREAEVEGLPVTRWVVPFDFPIDRK